ncbi:prepilin-type N-terminal cleavage/methylation domain-containing protein [Candidatus Peregrinibacteria bacterium]|nr:MAG: prepilin-type N-terminal cleavage/methylation domain-containing protein [Candidatus Peregrinibacteria bacterium]
MSIHLRNKNRGFSLAELLIALTLLAVVIGSSATLYRHFFNSFGTTSAANAVYEEARFMMERMVQAARMNTLDYEEYFNQVVYPPVADPNPPNHLISTYGQNYCNYHQQFYGAGLDGQINTRDDESMGTRSTATYPSPSRMQKELYLINQKGDHRMFFKRVSEIVNGVTVGKVALVELVGLDDGIDHLSAAGGCARDAGEDDGYIDTWVCDPNFDCPSTVPVTCASNAAFNSTIGLIRDEEDNRSNSSFVDITPDSLDVVDLSFIITPTEDPHKAYNDPALQIQPHVTIKLTVRANPTIANSFDSTNPTITLMTTATSRLYNGVETRCALQ